MRDRLIELLNNFKYECLMSCKDGFITKKESCDDCVIDQLADHILANGVIVPPCKVGDTVYAVDKRSRLWWKGKVIVISCSDKNSVQIAVGFEDGEVAVYEADCVFPTREEAEQALKGGAEL